MLIQSEARERKRAERQGRVLPRPLLGVRGPTLYPELYEINRSFVARDVRLTCLLLFPLRPGTQL